MSYKVRRTDNQGSLPTVSATAEPQIAQVTREPAERTGISTQRFSMTSVSSSGRRSSSSVESSLKGAQTRPSAIPRLAKTPVQVRSVTPMSKPGPMYTNKSKTSPSISTAPTMINTQGSAGNSTLQPRIGRLPSKFSETHARRIAPSKTDAQSDTVFGVALPERRPGTSLTNLPPRLIPELQALAAVAHKPQVAMSSISTISSPSTRFTDSPSPWSASTTATTPISWSSASPCIMQSARSPVQNKRAHTVPVPAFARAQLPRLPVLQEGVHKPAAVTAPPLTQSPSYLTTNAAHHTVTPPRKIKKKLSGSPVPTPPPRSSSLKRMRSRSSNKGEELNGAVIGHVAPPIPNEGRFVHDTEGYYQDNQESRPVYQPQDLTKHHNSLQVALHSTPSDRLSGSEEMPAASSLDRVQDESIEQSQKSKKLLDPARIVTAPQSHQSARSRLAKFSKIALFSRAGKVATVEAEPTVVPKKTQRGPVAGTGHEGYGIHSRKGRRTSTEGSGAGTDSESSVLSTTKRTTRSTSREESRNAFRRDRRSQSDVDDFASSRLKPIVMIGGSKRSASGTRYSHDSITTSVAGHTASTEDLPQRPSRELGASPVLSEAVPHVAETESFRTAVKRSAVTRSILPHSEQTDLLSPSESVVRSPEFVPNPYLNSWNTSQSSVAPSYTTSTDVGSDMYRVESNLLEKQKKKSRKLKWNIFKKKEDAIDMVQPSVQPKQGTEASEMTVSVSTIPVSRPMPYYAMLESESDINHTEAIRDYLTEAARGVDAEDDGYFALPITRPSVEPRHRVESVLLPTAPHFRRSIEASRTAVAPSDDITNIANMHSPLSDDLSRRPPRLVQVGRIPKVVQTGKIREPYRKSFSRPFPPSEVRQVDKDGERSHLQPMLEVMTGTQSHRSTIGPDYGRSTGLPVQSSFARARILEEGLPPEIFGHNDRQSTTSSSSDGMISVMGPPLLPSADLVRPFARSTVHEDDIWNEYDDFIDHVTSPMRDNRPYEDAKPLGASMRESIMLPSHPVERKKKRGPPALVKGLAINTSFSPAPIIYASPELFQESDNANEIRLRRSRIVSALHSSMDPSSPFSIGDYFSEHNDARNSGKDSSRGSDYLAGRVDLSSPRKAVFSERLAIPNQTQPQAHHYENVVHMEEVERSRNPIRHSELSYTSLMVSRWLSFGRVLFSPAHTEIERQPERHVLVIDGLGSDDWSIYCAVTYQTDQAYIYDLKETGQSRVSQSAKGLDQAPPNLRRREMASFDDQLKFPDNFFSAIVLRFPPAMAESKMRNLMSECRRVLTPSGYMELMLLDLDIVNMGVLTRRAMRNLKTKMSMTDPSISLRPLIDNVQGILGETGFSKLSKCMVGVPVVGKPSDTTGSPASSRSSGGSGEQRLNTTAGPQPFAELQGQASHNFSLNDLVADHSDHADTKISKMVSRTARSWWQHCFEAAVISDGNLAKSIFADKQVLNECKTRASSFKLLIAYTQKPSTPTLDMKRRTMSEPAIATLATM